MIVMAEHQNQYVFLKIDIGYKGTICHVQTKEYLDQPVHPLVGSEFSFFYFAKIQTMNLSVF